MLNCGIRVLVQLGIEEPPVQPPRELVYLRFPLLDGPGNDPDLLGLAIHLVAALIQQRIPTIVCCGAGMSRSPAVAAAALSVALDSPFGECLRKVLEGRPADVSPGLLADVRAALETATDRRQESLASTQSVTEFTHDPLDDPFGHRDSDLPHHGGNCPGR
jgi:hypothetical protein